MPMTNNSYDFTFTIGEYTALSEVFTSAVSFFESAGVKFIHKKYDMYQPGILIHINDKEYPTNKVKMLTPCCFGMSRDTLAALYTEITKNGSKSVKDLISVISHETAVIDYFMICDRTPEEIVKKFCGIVYQAIPEISKLRNIGGIYRLIGGNAENSLFFREAIKATINESELEKIPCYSCKYCRVDKEKGIRVCTKYVTLVDTERYAQEPSRYFDAVHSEYLGGLASHIIDERIDECEAYECRIPRLK